MRTHHKDLYRRLEGLLAMAEARSEDASDLDAIVGSFIAAFVEDLGTELGFTSALIARERRGRFVFPPGATEDLDLAPVVTALGREPTGVFIDPRTVGTFGAQQPCAVILVGEEPERLLFVFGIRGDEAAGVDSDSLLLTLSILRSVLAARLLAARFDDTLRQATLIQQSLLPSRAPRFPGFDLAARSIAAHDVGGDLFDFLPLDEGLIALAVGDASGHGLPAALLARDVVVGLRMGLEGDLKSGSVLGRLNSVVHASALSSCFVSLFLAELESNGSLFYFNAGHEPPLLFEAGGRAEELAGGELVLGPLPDTRFKRRFAHIDRGSTLLIFSDGLLERRGGDDELFGRGRLEDAARAHLADGAQAIVDAVFDASLRFGGSARWEDDATLVVVQREAP